MNKYLLISLLFAGSLLADPATYLVPDGPWTICPQVSWACASTSWGWYNIGIQGSTAPPDTVAYAYTITAKMVGKNEIVVIQREARRDLGFDFTVEPVYIGGLVESSTISIECRPRHSRRSR